ncbi:hypothetical protein F4777DRAFT_563296 [Nemania sp. FL0916]|nr:hypothetical protein F4777DRAFT_563296 [Nemania sp. FL0916]
MQFTTAALSLFVAVAAAQNSTTSLPDLVSQLPPCAIPCYEQGADAANCSTTDFQCICGKGKDDFINNAAICVATKCSSDEINNAGGIAGQICADVQNNPSPSDLASASAIVTSALGAPTASETPGAAAAFRPEFGVGVMGAVAALLAL